MVHFAFDSEWDAYNAKTMRIAYHSRGMYVYYDVLFESGKEAYVNIPSVYNTNEIEIGVYAGDIRTTTKARIPCKECITDGCPEHLPPSKDVYNQIMELLSKHPSGGGGSDLTGSLKSLQLCSGNPVISGVPEYGEPYDPLLWDVSADAEAIKASASATITTEECLLLACVMHRVPDLSIDGDGWEKIVTSQAATYSDGTNQMMTVWAKHVPAGSYDVHVTQNTSIRIGLKAIALYRAAKVSVVQDELISKFPFTPEAPTGKRRLYLLSSILATAGDPAIVVDSASLLQSSSTDRFTAGYDYLPELHKTPIYQYNAQGAYTAGSANALVLDIEEE